MVTTSQSRLDCDAVVKADQAAQLSSAVFVSELYGALGRMITPSSVFPFQQQDRFQRRADNVEGRVCVPPTFTLARTKLPCNICGEALRCRLSTKQMTSHLRDSHISLRSDPTFGPTDGLEYGSLRWFRIALAWRRPCQGLVCLDPPTTRAIDTSKYNVPLMFLLSINLIDLARERAYPVLLKAMETLSLHHKAVALKHWLKLYIDYNSDLTKSTVAQYIRLLQRKWRSKKELGMRMKHNFIFLTTREREKLTNYIDDVEVKASRLKAFIVFGTKRRLVPSSRLLALVVNLQRTFRSRMATSYHIRSCMDHHVGSSATIELQRITRGVRARNRSKRRQQINYHHITRTRYETTQSSAFYNFERQGAAKTIQTWFKTRSQDANCTWSIRESRKTQLVRTLQPAIRQKRPSNTIQLDGRNERRLQINAMTKRTALIFIRHNLRKWRRRHQKDKQVKATSKHRLAHTDTIRSKLDCIARTNPKGERNMAHGIIALQSVHRRSVARAKVAMIKNKRVDC